MFYTLTNRDGQQTLSVFGESFEKVIASTHPNFATLVNYLTSTQTALHDEAFVRGLVDPTVGIGREMAEITDRITFDMHHLYFDGVKVNGLLARHIKDKMLSNDQDWKRLVRFMLNLDANPSYRSQQETYQFLEVQGLTITEDGCFIAYKGVRHDGLSSHAGPYCKVNGEWVTPEDPTTDAHVPNEVGTVVSIDRKYVDDNPDNDCSHGLHVGSHNYAKDFAPRLLTVKVNPANVVSVPHRGVEKVRVTEYEVIDIAPEESVVATSWEGYQNAPKSEERLDREEDLNAITEDQRKAYDYSRKVGNDHETALQFALDGGKVPTDAQEPEEAYEALTTDAPETVVQTFADGIQYAVSSSDQFETEETIEDYEAGTVRDAQGHDHLVTGDLDLEGTLETKAAVIPDLLDDLENTDLGHKPLARKWATLTTEASVRRYRKSKGIKTSFSAKVKDAVS